MVGKTKKLAKLPIRHFTMRKSTSVHVWPPLEVAFFSTSKTPEHHTMSSSSGDVGVVSKEQRKACWSARDEYYHCKAIKGEEDCQAQKKAFYKLCPDAWVRSCVNVVVHV